jgi:ribonuclease HI
MELRACIEGLTYLLKNEIKEEITLISDSNYCLGIASGKYMPQKNLEDCYLLRELVKCIKPNLQWVRGHSGNIYNERCDVLAKEGKLMVKG